MKKILFLALLMVFLALPFASALDFTHSKDYNPDTQTVIVKDWFGLGSTLGNATLLTPQINYVIPGKDRLVAEFSVNTLQNYEGILSRINLYNINKGNQPFDRNITYKYKTITNIESPHYDTVCIDTGQFESNGTSIKSCDNFQNGIDIVEEDSWTILDTTNLPQNASVDIGLFTDVMQDDHVEWVPTLFGVNIDEWAVWLSSYNVGLEAYFNMNNSANAYVGDNTGKYNITNSKGTMNYTTSGAFIVNSVAFNGTGGTAGTNGYFNGTCISRNCTNVTINMWIKPRSLNNTGRFMWGLGDKIIFQVENGNRTNFVLSNNGVNNFIGLTLNQWVMLTAVENQTGVTYYVNGSATGQSTARATDPLGEVWLGTKGDGTLSFNGYMDEIGVWNRTLTSTEISQIFNSGAGMSYDPLAQPLALGVILSSPSNASNFSVNYALLNVTANPVYGNLTNATFLVWNSTNSLVNFTTLILLGNITNSTILNVSNLVDGVYYWNVNVTATNGTSLTVMNESNFTFRIDRTGPNIALILPSNNLIIQTPTNISLNYTNSDSGVGNASCWYNLDNGANITLNGCVNSTFIAIVGDHVLNFFANDTLNNVNTTQSNFTVINTTVSQIFNITTIETANEGFSIMLNSSSNVVINWANFTYGNSTNATQIVKTTSGNLTNYSTTASVPFLASGNFTNSTFYWTFNMTYNANNQLLNSSPTNQSDYKMLITQCGGITNATTLNYTTYYESNRSVMGGTNLQSSFVVWLPQNYPTLSLAEQYSFNRNSTGGSYPFCIYPAWQNYVLNAFDTASNSNGFSPRNHILTDAPINNVTQNVSIYLLDSSNATATVIKTVDPNLIPIPLITVRMQKFYPELNQYIEVDNGITDDLGQAVIQAQQFYTTYRFLFYNGTTLILQTDPSQLVCYSNPCVITYVMNGTKSNLFDNYLQTGLAYSLAFNNNTNNVTFSFSDANAFTSSFQLLVQKYNSTGTSVVCNNTVAGSSGNSICGLSSSGNGTYFAQAYYTQNNAVKVLDRLSASVETNAVQMFGNEGLFWTLIFILEMAMVGIWNPVVAVGMVVVAVSAIFIFGFVSMSYLVVVSVIILGGVVISQLRT